MHQELMYDRKAMMQKKLKTLQAIPNSGMTKRAKIFYAHGVAVRRNDLMHNLGLMYFEV
jgi:hypothetical protein